MTTRAVWRRGPAAVAATLLVLALGGCVGLPDDGPVVEADAGQELDEQQASDIDARPPRDGASRLEIVSGFLEAMTAWPIQTNVAKEYLTGDAAGEWNPEAATVVYTDFVPPREVGAQVRVELTDADRLDASGGWRGAVPEGQRTLRFSLAVEDGQFRIVDPPDALVVPAPWFQQRFRQVSLYYFEPTAQILVPEPVFVPVGEQLATSLIEALIAEPARRLRDVVRTFVPPDLSVGLSVPVSDSGVADIALVGDAPRPSADQAALLLAQLAWTLRQDPAISAFRLSIGGEELPLPGGASQYDLDTAAPFDPAGNEATDLLFGLRGDWMVAGGFGSLEPVTGPFGRRWTDVTSISVAPRAGFAAAVTGADSVLVSRLRSGEDARLRTVVSGGTEIAQPTWDYADRLWVLDRTSDGARLVLVDGRRTREVRVPGVTGTDARRIVVSRDGTRLAALVGGPEGDRLVVSRVVIDARGRVVRAIDPTVIWSTGGGPRVLDLAWIGSAEVGLLTPARPGALYEVETVVADGASLGVDTQSTTVSGRVIGLAGSPEPDAPLFAVLPKALVDVRTLEVLELGGQPVTTLDYAG